MKTKVCLVCGNNSVQRNVPLVSCQYFRIMLHQVVNIFEYMGVHHLEVVNIFREILHLGVDIFGIHGVSKGMRDL